MGFVSDWRRLNVVGGLKELAEMVDILDVRIPSNWIPMKWWAARYSHVLTQQVSTQQKNII